MNANENEYKYVFKKNISQYIMCSTCIRTSISVMQATLLDSVEIYTAFTNTFTNTDILIFTGNTYSWAAAGALDNSLDFMSESESSPSTGMSNLTA